jgi:hypothetical protein
MVDRACCVRPNHNHTSKTVGYVTLGAFGIADGLMFRGIKVNRGQSKRYARTHVAQPSACKTKKGGFSNYFYFKKGSCQASDFQRDVVAAFNGKLKEMNNPTVPMKDLIVEFSGRRVCKYGNQLGFGDVFLPQFNLYLYNLRVFEDENLNIQVAMPEWPTEAEKERAGGSPLIWADKADGEWFLSKAATVFQGVQW